MRYTGDKSFSYGDAIIRGSNGREMLSTKIGGKRRNIDAQYVRDIAITLGHTGLNTLQAWSIAAVKYQVIASYQGGEK